MKKYSIIVLGALSVLCASCVSSKKADDYPKTTFQTTSAWKSSIDVRADAVIVYGMDNHRAPVQVSFEDRINSWREKGYRTDFMTGMAWGGYEDYFSGDWDGKEHWDEGQKDMEGNTIWHTINVPYVVPTLNFLEYFKKTQVERAIDAGALGLYFEEPEFWAFAGYSDAFKREWEDYYGFPYQDQQSSPEAAYLSAKLKYHLYLRALDSVSSYAKDYGRKKGVEVKCYVPTHSLLNYSQWQIVSPEASLALLPDIDGYIAQVWTGTSRVPFYYNGVFKERTFETAYLEYACMVSMTAPTGRRMWLLTDPIEDGRRDWQDYRRNYHATFAAQLFQSSEANYEIMPWPKRIYEGLYAPSAGSSERVRLPSDYATMMQVMTSALQDIPASKSTASGSRGINILMGNSLMFQRFPEFDDFSDPAMSGFYGMAAPLLKRGVPVGISHIENLGHKAALKGVKVLIMSYSTMKPLSPEAHSHIACWIKGGGKLIYCGNDSDPFQGVSEWWNSDGLSFAAPSDHLFSLLGLGPAPAEGTYSFGKGSISIIRQDPKVFVMEPGADSVLLDTVGQLYSASGEELELKNYLTLRRGPYMVAAVLDESVSDDPLEIKGVYTDLFDPELPVVTDTILAPGNQAFLYDISRAGKAPKIIAAASKAYDVTNKGGSFSFTAKGPEGTLNVSRILLSRAPESVTVDGIDLLDPSLWDAGSNTYLLKFTNRADGVSVSIR